MYQKLILFLNQVETDLYLVHRDESGKVVTVLRDTGCSNVFVSSNLVSDNQKTDRAKVVTLADMVQGELAVR